MFNRLKKIVILMMIMSLCLVNVCQSKAAKVKRVALEKTLTTFEVGAYGALLPTVVETYTAGTEYYVLQPNKKIKYTNRRVYGYCIEHAGYTYYTCYADLIRHFNSAGKQIRSFSWKDADSIWPRSKFRFCRENNTPVVYSRSNNNYALWSVGIYAPDAFYKNVALVGKIKLHY